jgi:sialic acid synthase
LREIVIDGIRIADDTDCYIIAEIGHNHGGNLETCKQMFKAAKEAGAHAVKLQKRDNRTLYTTDFYNTPYNSENAFGSTYGSHREALEFDLSQYVILQDYAKELGITFFATAFDLPSLDFLLELDMPAIKIASGDLTNSPLLKAAGRSGKPVILSTGGGSIGEVCEAHNILDGSEHAILQCTSGYPAKYEELNLGVVGVYRNAFRRQVIGYSGHDNGIAMPMLAYALGARIVEKHFTLDRTLKGTDQSFSLEPPGLRKMARDLRRARQALGDGVKRPFQSELLALAKQWKNGNGQIDGKGGVSGTEECRTKGLGNGNIARIGSRKIYSEAH